MGLLAALALLMPVIAHGGADPASLSFERFCSSWIGKLAVRERNNIKRIRFRKYGNNLVGDYTGYSSEPVKCAVKKTGVPEAPFVGRLVYYEIHYRKAGKSRKAARRNEPSVLAQIEVTEIFRFDGQDWVY